MTDSLIVFMNLMPLTSGLKSPEDENSRFLQKILATITKTIW